MTLKLAEADRDVLNIMRDGADTICDHASRKWMANEYGTSEQMRQDSLKQWREKRQRAHEIISELREQIKGA
jgi:hypothetical protein